MSLRNLSVYPSPKIVSSRDHCQVKRPVILRNAEVRERTDVGGTYVLNGVHNDKPVYAKEGDADRWLFFAADKTWMVANTVSDEESKLTRVFAQSSVGLAHPGAAKKWEVPKKWKWQLGSPHPVDVTVMVS